MRGKLNQSESGYTTKIDPMISLSVILRCHFMLAGSCTSQMFYLQSQVVKDLGSLTELGRLNIYVSPRQQQPEGTLYTLDVWATCWEGSVAYSQQG